MIFPSKILLAGEYCILYGGSGLAIPFDKYCGTFRFNTDQENRILNSLRDYLIEKDVECIDTSKMSIDIEKGLWFDSNIPQGGGLGSSGALVAALYHRFGKPYMNTRSLLSNLICIENFFHGNSSGIDPLVSYLNRAIIFNKNELVELSRAKIRTQNLYLYNSGIPRATKKLVATFKKLYSETSLEIQSFNLLNQQLIHYLRGGDAETPLSTLIKDLSTFQYEYFSFAIDESTKAIWKEGLLSDSYFMKLCGAGGGGSYLLFSEKHLPGLNLQPI